METRKYSSLPLLVLVAAMELVVGYGTGYAPQQIAMSVDPSYGGGLYQSPQSEYHTPPCSQYYHAQFPSCVPSSSYSQTNCTVVLDNMYTIEYKEECGRRYNKVCYGPHNTDCKAVVDPGCYQVPTHSPVQVPREICYNPATGERCDNYNQQLSDSYPVRC